MYEDYMQNLLGDSLCPYQYTYEPIVRNTNYYNQIDSCDQYNHELNYEFPYYNCRQNYFSRNLVVDIENMYPEIYKIIYPMIQKACMQNSKPLTEDVIEDMTDDIYNNIEANSIINLNIDIVNNRNDKDSISSNTSQITHSNESRNSSKSVHSNEISNTTSSVKNADKSIQNREYRQANNPIRDLIKILLIRELLGDRPSARPPMPFPPGPKPFPPRPPRPPMPSRPGNQPLPPRPRF